MLEDERHSRSQLFTVRLWSEEVGAQQREYRGEVKRVASGATRHFRTWADLQKFLTSQMDEWEGETRGQAEHR